jgi:hypothetical protein
LDRKERDIVQGAAAAEQNNTGQLEDAQRDKKHRNDKQGNICKE